MDILMVGIGGYGAEYLRHMERIGCFGDIVGVVDPVAKLSPFYQRFVDGSIPIYDSMDAFYQKHTADIAIISSPIQFHEAQSIAALENGSHVLCEKPLTARLEQAQRMHSAQKKAGKLFGVGFQWSFCAAMQRLKRNILDGVYGKPVCFKSYVSWPRLDAYYNESSWKGRRLDDTGAPIYDSVVTNATAHYLHNMFFLLGDTMHTSGMPKEMDASLYRVRPIETFDTCFLRGTMQDGATFFFAASHASDRQMSPMFCYEFEHADVVLSDVDKDIMIHWKDGRVETFGLVGAEGVVTEKILSMFESVRTGTPVACDIDAVLPHLTVCNALFDQVPVHVFDESVTKREKEPDTVFVPGFYEAGMRCYEAGKMPDTLDIVWAKPSTHVMF